MAVTDHRNKGWYFESYILYECDGAYLLRSRRTGLHFFPDEVVHVARLPGE